MLPSAGDLIPAVAGAAAPGETMLGGETIGEPLLVLDLDETLIHATEERPPRGHDFRVGTYYVVKRPFVDEFLKQMFRWFRVAVWTSAGAQYADDVVRQLFPAGCDLEFVRSASRCTRRFDGETGERTIFKDLGKVRRRGYRLERILMIDDLRENLSRHYGNHLRLEPFRGDPSDRELLDVLPFLDRLREQANFRTIEKRNWREADRGSGRPPD